MSPLRPVGYISTPDAALESLKKKTENAKALYEYAKEQYDRTGQHVRDSGAGRSDWAIATEAYSFSLTRYLDATLALNRHLFDCAFGREATVLGAAA